MLLKEEIIEILKNNEENINEGNWEAVYDSIDELSSRGSFTKFLIENDIDLNTVFKTEIPAYAFFHFGSLTSFTIPNGVIEICASAFSSCPKLTSINIPNSVKYIDQNAFYGCSSLTSVTIPNSVKEIDDRIFFDCSSLKEIKFDGTREQWNKIKLDKYWDASCPAKIIFLK